MINRDKQLVQVVSFIPGKDEYGRPRRNGETNRLVEMYVSIYQKRNVDDIRYVEVTNIGLTADKGITDTNQIIIGDDKYQVLYVLPSRRLYQVLMKKV